MLRLCPRWPLKTPNYSNPFGPWSLWAHPGVLYSFSLLLPNIVLSNDLSRLYC